MPWSDFVAVINRYENSKNISVLLLGLMMFKIDSKSQHSKRMSK